MISEMGTWTDDAGRVIDDELIANMSGRSTASAGLDALLLLVTAV